MSRGEPNLLFLPLAIPMTGGRRNFGDAQVNLAGFRDHSNNPWYLLYLGSFPPGKQSAGIRILHAIFPLLGYFTSAWYVLGCSMYWQGSQHFCNMQPTKWRGSHLTASAAHKRGFTSRVWDPLLKALTDRMNFHMYSLYSYPSSNGLTNNFKITTCILQM